MDILHRTRPKAFTEDNIKSRFRKTGLNPFNPAFALRQLPLLPHTPPCTHIPLEFQTPKNVTALNFCIDAEQNASEEGQKVIRAKINKACTMAMTKIVIRERDDAQREAFEAEQHGNRARKRRRALGGEALTVGQAKQKVKELEQGHKQRQTRSTTRSAKTHKRPATPDSSEESFEDISDSDLSDISSCIVCEPLE